MVERTAVAAQLVAKEIEELRRRGAEIAETARVANEKLAEDVKVFKRLILNGKTASGDRITDFFLGAYEIIDDAEASKPLRNLAKRAAGKQGQFFLVIERERKRHVFGGPGHSSESDYHLETQTFLGILSADGLYLDPQKQSFGLPTESFVELLENRPMEKRPGPFLFSGFLSPWNIEQTISAGRDSGPQLEIILGCDAVFAYSPNKYARKTDPRPKDWVCALNSAIRMLGRNIPEAPEETAARAAEEQDVLTRLEAKYFAFGVLRKDSRASSEEIARCEDMVRASLAKAKELGLGKDLLVVLVESKLG